MEIFERGNHGEAQVYWHMDVQMYTRWAVNILTGGVKQLVQDTMLFSTVVVCHVNLIKSRSSTQVY